MQETRGEEYYPSAGMQFLYSTFLADWAKYHLMWYAE